MNSKRLILGVVSLSALAACHDHHDMPPPPAPPTSQSFDTAHILSLAQQTSETSAPIALNGGAVTLNDTSETSAPIAVNAM